MSDPHKTAKQIEEDMKVGAKVRADSEAAEANKIDQLLEAVGSLSTCMKSMSDRMDAMEAKTTAKADDDDPGEVMADAEDERKTQSLLTEAQARADSVFQAWGLQAPKPMAGEEPLNYRRRMLRKMQHNSERFKDQDLSIVDPRIFDAVEGQIYADSMAASACPLVPEGTLHPRVTTDDTGRRITTWFGEPRAWLDQFAGHRQMVVKFNTQR